MAWAMGEKEPGEPRTDGSKLGGRQRVFSGAVWGGAISKVEGRVATVGGCAPISPKFGGMLDGESLGGEKLTANPFCTIKLLTS